MRNASARYLFVWLGSTAALLVMVALFNVIVDPYGLFGLIDKQGFNRIKSQASERGSLFKRVGVERMQPKGLVLGNSRAEIGFDPESSTWPAAARPAFNLAIPGAGIGAVAREFARALSTSKPKVVVVGLDFIDFRVDPSSDERFDGTPVPVDRAVPVRDRAMAVLTMSALIDSLATLRAQRDPYATGLTSAGFNPKRDYVGVARREGYHALFRQRNQENALAYLRGPRSIYQSSGRPAPGFAAVDSIIALARDNGVKLRFVIYPYHAHTLVLFHLTGLWPAYEDWKRELVRRVDAATDTMDVELWDFTGFSRYTAERVPRPGDTQTELEWYWEAGHFKKSLGDRVLANVFGVDGNGDNLGRRLRGADLEDHLREQRRARERFELDRPDDYAQLAALVAAAARR